jgi:hypothetical protein
LIALIPRVEIRDAVLDREVVYEHAIDRERAELGRCLGIREVVDRARAIVRPEVDPGTMSPNADASSYVAVDAVLVHTGVNAGTVAVLSASGVAG